MGTVNPVASTSTADTPAAEGPKGALLCAVCRRQDSRYTCPRCGTRSCSLGCSQAHKTAPPGCSGERERAGYVPMHAYGDVSMWRDLAYLREVGEKAAAWGKDVAPRKATSRSSRDDSRNGDRDRRIPDSIRELSQNELRLRHILGRRGIELLFLPKGMERHKANRSRWDPKKRKLHLTVTVSYRTNTNEIRHATTVHNRDPSTTLSSLIMSALPSNLTIDVKATAILLPEPIRPVVFSSRSAEPLIPPSSGAKLSTEDDKPLPLPHASLPVKPSWAAEGLVEVDDTQHKSGSGSEPLSSVMTSREPQRVSTEAPARRMYRLPFEDSSFEGALMGTRVLEWPCLEVWPIALVNTEVAAGRLEIISRREWVSRERTAGGRKRPHRNSFDEDRIVQPAKQEDPPGGGGFDTSDEDSSDVGSRDDGSDEIDGLPL